MPNGKPGDHPFTDILHLGHSEYGEPVDSFVKKLAAMPGFDGVRGRVASILWDNSPMGRMPERAALVASAMQKLEEIERELQ